MKQFILNITGKIPENRKKIYLATGAGLALMISLGGIGAIAFGQTETPPAIVETGGEQAAEKKISTVNPVLVSGSSSVILLGTVLSHETANIYPRRDGIVEDVLVDIGDEVKKNQVIALLLPGGVEGESAAMIAEKSAMKLQADVEALNAVGVAREAVNQAKKELDEKKAELDSAGNEQEAMLRKFSLLNDNVSQALEHAFISVRRARQLIEKITTGTNTRTGKAISENRIDVQLGIIDPKTRFNLANAFSRLDSAEKDYGNGDFEKRKKMVHGLMENAIEVLLRTADLLAASPSDPLPNSDFYTEEYLAELNNMVIEAQHDILDSKEEYEDMLNDFLEMAAGEPALFAAWKSGSKDPAVQSNDVRMLSAQVETAKQNLTLMQSEQNQMIQNAKNMAQVASAALAAQYASSGHREIRSPFSGTISKRFISVGDMTSASMPAFELTDVETSLSKKAKREIQFGLPENLRSSVEVGDKIEFSLPGEEEKRGHALVTRKSPQVDSMTHAITVQAKVPDDFYAPHQTSVRVRIIDTKKPVFRLLSASIKREENSNFVWLLDPDKETPEKLTVSVISEDGEFAEVTGDLSEESEIFIEPPVISAAQKLSESPHEQ